MGVMEIGDRHPDIAVDPVARACTVHLARPDCRDVRCRSHVDEAPPDTLAAPPTERKAYAVDPPGRPTRLPEPTPPDPDARETIPVWIPVTNLGTLLDILA
jgi:hypothetical protein